MGTMFTRSGVGRTLGVMAVLLVAVLGGCARTGTSAGTAGAAGPTGSTTASAGPTPVPSTTVPLPAEPLPPTGKPDAVDGSGCHTNLRLSEVDSGKSYCVSQGGTVTVELHGLANQPWRPVQLSGDALELSAGGGQSVGVTVTDTFRAVRAGSAELTSARSLCPPAKPGSVSCNGMIAFEVDIQVR
jgi:hypothetical protein